MEHEPEERIEMRRDDDPTVTPQVEAWSRDDDIEMPEARRPEPDLQDGRESGE